MSKQMCVCRAERVAGDGGGLGAEILRVKSDGSEYRAPNIDPSRTHLNRSIVDCGGRGGNAIRAAIDRRIREAGVTRKVTADQCRAVVMYLSGTHDQMALIEAEGRLDEWTEDCRAWLAEQWGEDNIVALELHRDEYTPHLHAVVVPITTEARRRRGREDERRRYQVRPKVRLSADHYLSKARMRGWQDSYAARMSKYGLERGVAGSRARHQTMNEYYRHLREDLIPEAESIVAKLGSDCDQIYNDVQTAVRQLSDLQAAAADKRTEIEGLEGLGAGIKARLEGTKEGLRELLGRPTRKRIKELEKALEKAQKTVTDYARTIRGLIVDRDTAQAAAETAREDQQRDQVAYDSMMAAKQEAERALVAERSLRARKVVEEVARVLGCTEEQARAMIDRQPQQGGGIRRG